MKRLKILWLSHLIPYPPKGGVLQRSYNLLRELAKYHDVYLVAFNQSALLETHFKTTEDGLIQSKSHLSSFCLDVEFLTIPCEKNSYGKYLLGLKGLLSPLGYTNEWLKSGVASKTISRITASNQFDFVHFDTISLAPYKHIVKGIPSSLDHHNVESHMMLRRARENKNPFKKLYFFQEASKIAAYETKMVPEFEVNITCSQLDNERLKSLIPNSLCVEIPNGVDLDYFSASQKRKKVSSTDEFKVIFAGRLNAYTNQKAAKDLIYKIWPQIRTKFPNAKCILVGSNPPKELVIYSTQVSWLEVTGFVDDVRPLIEDADLYLCPITDGGGTKLKVLDALALGIPLIADPIACEGISVKDGVNVLLATTPEDYVSKITSLIDNPEQYKSLAVNGRKLIEEKYSYLAIGKELSNVVSKSYKVN